MSKYIIDIPKTVGMGKVGSVHYTYFDGIQCQTIVLKSDEIEELNSDYINEHYGDLMDEEIRQALSEVREMKQMCGNINMKLANIVTQRGQDIKKKLEAEYQRGLDDAWEAARKVGHCKLWDDYTKDTGKPSVCAVAVLDHYTAYEAIEKLKAYEEKQKAEDEIKVGDEVKSLDDSGVEIEGFLPWVVTSDDGDDYYQGIDNEGKVHAAKKVKTRKTGRHFNISSILKEMQS